MDYTWSDLCYGVIMSIQWFIIFRLYSKLKSARGDDLEYRWVCPEDGCGFGVKSNSHETTLAFTDNHVLTHRNRDYEI